MSIVDRLFIQLITAVQSLKSEDGQGMVEYGLVLALVAVACVAGFTALGTKIASTIGSVTSAL